MWHNTLVNSAASGNLNALVTANCLIKECRSQLEDVELPTDFQGHQFLRVYKGIENFLKRQVVSELLG